MRNYELVFIVDPRLKEEEAVAVSDEIKGLVEAQNGLMTKEESWGKRRLAYPIGNSNEGNYFLFQFEVAEGNPIPEIEQRLRQNDNVLRYLTVRPDQGRLRVRGVGPEADGDEPEAATADSQEDA